ncbi:MAG TPA: amidohydrolase family protein [bacterium]|nr:amidohydrolase family protein [bacterium]
MREYFDFNVMIGAPTVVQLGKWLDTRMLSEEMRRFNIKKAIAYHSYSRDYDAYFGNNYMIKEITGYSDILPCWVLLPFDISPTNTPDELISQLKENNVKIVRLFPELHNFLLEEEVVGDLLALLEGYNVPVLISPNKVGWRDIYSILRNHPNLRLILVDLNYRNSSYIFPLLKRYKNVYIELSGYTTYLGIEGIYKRFGGEHMLFWSNLHYKSPGITIFYVENADVPEEIKDLIAYKNGERLIEEVTL